MYYTNTEKKDRQYKEFDLSKRIPQKGDIVILKEKTRSGEDIFVKILDSVDDNILDSVDDNIFEVTKLHRDKIFKIRLSDIKEYSLHHVGVNPFDKSSENIRIVNYQLSSILSKFNLLPEKKKSNSTVINGVEVQECNFNPYVYDSKGEKKYYQREYCWTLKEKQLLIDSLYNNVDCGKVIVKLNSWKSLENRIKEGETEVAFADIVDGKQRLEALRGFLNNEYKDSYGNYYGDLSNHAQNMLLNNQLISYAEMHENTKDSDVLKQFLKMNFSGVPQSQEHLDYVKSLTKN